MPDGRTWPPARDQRGTRLSGRLRCAEPCSAALMVMSVIGGQGQTNVEAGLLELIHARPDEARRAEVGRHAEEDSSRGRHASGEARSRDHHGRFRCGGVNRAWPSAVRPRDSQTRKDAPRPLRLCLGSGHAPIDGWVNIDFEPPADILVDLRFGLPVRNASVTSIYSEHLVEHFSLDAAMGLFRDWRRAIAPDGTVRIATPDLERLLASCTSGEDWRSEHEWLTWPAYAQIDTPVRMLNTAMREWGHLYLYDFTELAGRLREAGFTDVRRVRIGESEDPDLRLLETRADSHLVVEARP